MDNFRVWARPLSSSNVEVMVMLQHTDTFKTVISLQFCCKNSGNALSYSNMTPVHEVRSLKTARSIVDKLGVKELRWPAQIPDLDHIEHLCDELEL